MDYGSSAITIVPDAGPMWATEDDYRSWAGGGGDANPNPSQSRDSSEQPPSKKSRSNDNSNSGGGGSNTNPVPNSTAKSRAIGKMFFKTKLCCKFRAGTCPYITNCNFAHGMEELRKPPPNWQEILAAAQSEQSQRPADEGSFEPPREEHSIPILTSSNVGGEGQRNYKGRHCKKFYTEEGCPYGDSCTFLHDEQSKARESVAISLSPSVGGGGGGGGGAASVAAGQAAAAAAVVSAGGQKPSNWKTRICNKWEMTGYCPFGSKCHFAHGSAELHKYGGGLVDTDGKEVTTPDSKQASAKLLTDTSSASGISVPHADVYHGVGSQRLQPIVSQRPIAQAQRPVQKWRGPDKISRIYGDWIDEID